MIGGWSLMRSWGSRLWACEGSRVRCLASMSRSAMRMIDHGGYGSVMVYMELEGNSE